MSDPSSSTALRKPVTETWDEFFDLSAEPNALRPLRPRLGARTSAATSKPEHDSGQARPGRASPADSFFSSWDDSPSPPPSTHEPQGPSSSSATASAALHLALPRHSPSHAPSLPSRSAPSSPPRGSTRLMASPVVLSPKEDQRRPKSATSNKSSTTHKLVKRHPSSSFIRPALPDHSSSSLSSTSMVDDANRAGPRLVSSRWRMFSEKGKSHRTESATRSRDKLPASSSQVSLDRKPGFLRRLSSSYKISANGMQEEIPGRHRRRSSSVGHPSSPTKSRSEHPPVPALPPNFRSASGTSNTSSSSAASNTEAESSRKLSRRDPAALRRSASSLSRQTGPSPNNPPVSYMPALGVSPYPSSLESPAVPEQPATPGSPVSSGSLSRGFHLPSPSPGSPYKSPLNFSAPLVPLPHSNSFPIQYHRGSDTEAEIDIHATPKRKSKIRPVSALPAPPAARKGWQPDNWVGPTPTLRLPSTASKQDAQSSVPVPITSTSRPPSPRNTSFKANAASAFRRIGSMSKKHGRRISDGFKFGGKRSTSPLDDRREAQALETVTGSPSKPTRSPGPDPTASPISQGILAASKSDNDAVSIHSAPNRAAPHEVGKTPNSDTPVSDDVVRKKTKQKKMRSSPWLTEAQLATQERLKAERAAMKHFASEVRKLKSQVEGSDAMLRRVQDHGTVEERQRMDDLAREFEEIFEMADLLVDLNDIGSTPDSQPNASIYASARARRVTLGSDKAKAMSQTLDKLTLNQFKDAGTRSISLPESDASMGPPRPPLPEQWRRSTGQQETANRQHELLLMMTQGGRPELKRGSTIPSASSSLGFPSGSTRQPWDPVEEPNLATSSAAAPESGRVAPSVFGPTPTTSPIHTAPLSPPPFAPKTRFGTKTGLTGLRELVRSLKTTSSREARPRPVQTDVFSPSGPASARTPVSPITPSTPFSSDAKEIDYPTSRSSFSGIPPTDGPLPRPSMSSPKKGSKRPNVRRIFHRSTSGSWAGLAAQGASSASAPPVPTQPRRSVDSSSGREGSSFEDGRRSRRQSSSRFVGGSAKPVKTPTSPRFGFLSARKASYGESESSSTEGVTGSQHLGGSPQRTPRRAKKGSVGPTPHGREGGVELDRTVRPARKSRLFGLGMPSSPSSPSSPSWVSPRWPQPDPPQPQPNGMDRTASDSTDWSLISGGTAATAGTEGTDITASSGGTRSGSGAGRPVIALTPDTIPMLQVHVGFCMDKLDEWKSRAEALVPGF